MLRLYGEMLDLGPNQIDLAFVGLGNTFHILSSSLFSDTLTTNSCFI